MSEAQNYSNYNFITESKKKRLVEVFRPLIDDKTFFRLKIVASASCLAMENCSNYVESAPQLALEYRRAAK